MKKYIPGSYSAQAEGMSKVDVKLTTDQNKITDIEINTEGESKDFGQAAVDELKNQVLTAQSADIDGVTGASLTSNAVKTAVKDALEQASGSEHKIDLSLNDGTYQGQATGHGGDITVELVAKDNKIKDVKVVSQTESPNVADYALTEIPHQIVQQQTLAVDAVTGATLTSRAVLNATQSALEKAGGDSKSWLLQDYKNPLDYEPQDLTTDVVIMGTGISGLTAGVFLTKAGKKVVLLEKNDQVGGSFRYSAGGYALANTEKLRKSGYDDKLENIMAYVHHLNDGKTSNSINEDFVEYLMSRSGKTFDELTDTLNAEVAAQLPMESEPYLHGTFGGAAGAHEADMMANYIKNNGGTILLNTKVTDYLEKDNKVTGLVAEHRGKQFRVEAPNIIFASGGTSYKNDELMQRFTPKVNKVHIFNEANVGNTGDGYRLLTKMGALKDGEDVYKNGFLDFAPELFITWSNVPSYAKSIIINSEGKRFTNEAPSETACVSAEMFKEGSPAYYLIVDDNTIDPSLKEKIAKVDQGKKTYVKAATVAELAQKLGISEKVLTDTVAAYNRAVEVKRDPFGKPTKDLVPVTGQGSYYAVYVMPGSWGTMGGIKINRQLQVKKPDGNVIKNVFAIGETSTGDLFSEYYMGGFSLAYYSTEGRLVADHIAQN